MAEVATIEDTGKRKRRGVVLSSGMAVETTSEGAPILAMIDKVLSIPDFPIDKLERLIEIYEKQRNDARRQAYDAAFAEMQPELPIIDKKGKGHNGKYGRWEDIVEQITPILAKHGFGLSFRTTPAPDAAKLRVTAILSHREGHREENFHDLPIDMTGSKNPIQGIGSTTSYGKRYTGSSIINLVCREEDDDGAAGGDAVISDTQADTLLRLIRDTKSDPQQFLAIAKVANISDIKGAQFSVLEAMLQAKKKKQGAPV